jgi:two-component system chemotaxis sensor kinase CheA
VIFRPNLPLADMKARLVFNRLSTRANILSTDPPVEQLDDIETLTRFTIYLTSDATHGELRSLADVEGVAETWIEPVNVNDTHNPTKTVLDQPSVSAASPSSSLASSVQGMLIQVPSPPVSHSAATIAGTSNEGPATKRVSTPAKVKVAETIRVESDRLDHLMNLAGELVITKARFVAIARGLDELFRGSNVRALASDTRERLESLTRGLEGLVGVESGIAGGLPDRRTVHIRQLRDNFRAIQDELDLIREAREQLKSLTETIHSLAGCLMDCKKVCLIPGWYLLAHFLSGFDVLSVI